MEKNKKICVICGRAFFCPPSTSKKTCGKECHRLYHQMTATGRKKTDAERAKISKSAKARDKNYMRRQQKIAMEAAKKSPNSGRFETNINAIDWHLISPDGKEFRFHSLNHWLRHDGAKYFDIDPENPDTKEFRNASSGLRGAKRGAAGKIKCPTYKGWRVIPEENE